MSLSPQQLCILLFWIGLIASSFWASEQLLPYASPVASTGLRFILATLLLTPIIAGRVSPYLKLGFIGRYGVIGFFLAMFFVGMFEALKTTSTHNTSVLYTLVPLFSVTLSFVWLKQRTSIVKLLGFFAGTGGAVWVLMISHQTSLTALDWHHGDGIFLLACACMAMHIVLIKKWCDDIPAMIGAFLILLTGSIILLPWMLMDGELSAIDWHQTRFWQWLLYLTICTTLLTFYLQQHLIRTVGPDKVLAFTFLIPTFVAVPQGLLHLSQFGQALPGWVLTILSLYLISALSRPKIRVSRE